MARKIIVIQALAVLIWLITMYIVIDRKIDLAISEIQMQIDELSKKHTDHLPSTTFMGL